MHTDPENRRRCAAGQAGGAGQPGFTLVELLIAIAVIGMLMALLVPTLARARLLAKRAACQANLSTLGKAVAVYQLDFGDYVPICWANIKADSPHPWKSWRASLLPYAGGFAAFNCPAAKDTGEIGEVFHSDAEITGQEMLGTINAGSYGVIFQDSLPSYKTLNDSGIIAGGHPMRSCAFSTRPRVAWRDPANSVYVADAYLAKGRVKYPSESHERGGTSAILPPSSNGYPDAPKFVGTPSAFYPRRFADRHCGTNCLFVGGHVKIYVTKDLDSMVAAGSDCVWDTD